MNPIEFFRGRNVDILTGDNYRLFMIRPLDLSELAII